MSAAGWQGNPGEGRVCVVGSLNMDLVARCQRLPNPGETILSDEFTTMPGGKGANQAVAAARAGASVAMIGVVGDDSHGDRLVAAIRAEGVDCSAVRVAAGTTTGVAMITVARATDSPAERGENTIVVAPGANHALDIEHLRRYDQAIRHADALLVQLESPLPVVQFALDAARAADHAITTILNAAPAQPLPPSLLARLDVLVVNRSEAAMLAELPASSSPSELLARLERLGPSSVVLTLGAAGAWASVRAESTRRRWRIAAFDVQPIDTVAAGDAFVGTLAASLATQTPWADALAAASAAGALAATRQGAMSSLPLAEEVDALRRAQPGVQAMLD